MGRLLHVPTSKNRSRHGMVEKTECAVGVRSRSTESEYGVGVRSRSTESECGVGVRSRSTESKTHI